LDQLRWISSLNFLTTFEKMGHRPDPMKRFDTQSLNSLVIFFRSVAFLALLPLTAYMIFLMGTDVTPIMRANLMFFSFISIGLLAITVVSYKTASRVRVAPSDERLLR
jgi:hypothetical protein